tara:strand:+ start:986 stop:1468 length:483 start_codon:yes stop_codon:yes gene_type:complete
MDKYQFKAPDKDVFKLWRAVFALVHVDGNFSQEEQHYIKTIIDAFSFTTKQKEVIRQDLENKVDAIKLFQEITQVDNQRQFFVMARTIAWCDGYLHEDEQGIIQKIVNSLGQDAKKFQKELRWLERKPIMTEGKSSGKPEDDLIQIVFTKMSAFYRENII